MDREGLHRPDDTASSERLEEKAMSRGLSLEKDQQRRLAGLMASDMIDYEGGGVSTGVTASPLVAGSHVAISAPQSLVSVAISPTSASLIFGSAATAPY